MANKSYIPTILIFLTLGYAAWQIASILYFFYSFDSESEVGKQVLENVLSSNTVYVIAFEIISLIICGVAIIKKYKAAHIIFCLLLIIKLIEQAYWFNMSYMLESNIALLSASIFYGGLAYGSFKLKSSNYYENA